MEGQVLLRALGCVCRGVGGSSVPRSPSTAAAPALETRARAVFSSTLCDHTGQAGECLASTGGGWTRTVLV